MVEKQTVVEVANEVKGEVSPARSSKQPFFGTLLLSFMLLLLLGALGLLGWWGYRGWRFTEEQSTLPSIASLEVVQETQKEQIPQEVVKTPVEQVSPASKEEALKKAQATDIKILNGGATKGSAGILGESLKKGGYTKISVGNTTGNYTGTVIYFAPGVDQEAAILKETLLKSYPKAEMKAALSDNKETSLASLTVILGKE